MGKKNKTKNLVSGKGILTPFVGAPTSQDTNALTAEETKMSEDINHEDSELLGGDFPYVAGGEIPANEGGSGSSSPDGDGISEDGDEVGGNDSVVESTDLAGKHGDKPNVSPAAGVETSNLNPPVSPSPQSTVSKEDASKLSPEPAADSGAGSGTIERILLGENPVTGEPVYSDNQ
jgi:hypothetical protein